MNFANMTVAQAQQWLVRNVGLGARCPCCSQMAKVYRRTINTGMARSLIAMYLHGQDRQSWVHLPTVIGRRSAEEGKLRYWKLVEERPGTRDDGGHAGFWRLTDLGRQFVAGQVTVPKYARVYNGKLLGLDGPQISIRDALGERFNYDELMAGDGLAAV